MNQVRTKTKYLEPPKKISPKVHMSKIGGLLLVVGFTLFWIGLFAHMFLTLIFSYVIFLALLLDFRTILTVDISKIRIKRFIDKKTLYLDNFTYIEVQVSNESKKILEYILIEDLFPVSLEHKIGLTSAIFSLSPGASGSFSYIVQVKERGITRIGPVRTLIRSPWSLFFIEKYIPAYDDLMVYPSMERSEKMYYVAKSRRTAKVLGAHRSKSVGAGTDFFGIREYTRYDDYRTIDWKASARMLKLMVKEFTIEIPLNIYLLIDSSFSMGYGKPVSKLDYAIDIAMMLSKISIEQHDKVGLIIFSDTIHSYVPAKSDPHNINRMLREFALAVPSGGKNYTEAIKYLLENTRLSGLIIILSDFEGDKEDIVEAIKLARLHGHKVFGLHLYTPYFEDDTSEKDLLTKSAEAFVFDKYETTRREIMKEFVKRGGIMISVSPKMLFPLLLEQYIKAFRGGRAW